jgi:hypothetical protein
MNSEHLPRLQSLQHENPTKRISLIRLAWPDIEKALARGHTLKLVHSRMIEDGLQISYSLLSLYVRRLRGKQSTKKRHQFGVTKASVPIQGADPRPENHQMEHEHAARVEGETAAAVEPSKERVLFQPRELNAIAEQDGKDGKHSCFFIEHIPDIQELFRVTKKSETAPAHDADFVSNAVSPAKPAVPVTALTRDF